jgi:hypothetical protein
MSPVQSILSRARAERQRAKSELLRKIGELLARYGSAEDYLARIVSDLNSENVCTLTGKAWTTRNLWQFMMTNAEGLGTACLGDEISESESAVGTQPSVHLKDVPPDLANLIEWAMRYRQFGVVPVAVSDAVLLGRVERLLEKESRSFSALVQDLLEQWLAKKENRIVPHKRPSESPVCLHQLDGVISIAQFRKAVVDQRS